MKKLLFAILACFVFAGAAFAAVNLNTASKDELTTLNGIGPVKAQAIINYRSKNGPFKSLEDLDKVPGIGQGTIGKIKGEVTLTGPTTLPAKDTAKENKASAKQGDAAAKTGTKTDAKTDAAGDTKAKTSKKSTDVKAGDKSDPKN
jgi:competence protein ComEA